MQTSVAYQMLPAMQILCHLVGPGNGPESNVTNLAVDQTTSQPQPMSLPEGYVAHPDVGFAYKVHTENVTWLEARSRCIQTGAQLALIDSAKKLEYVGRQAHTAVAAHVGIINLNKDKIWVAFNTGLQLTSLPWRDGEPSGGYNCVKVYFEVPGLTNGDCTDRRNYVCEIPILNNDAVPAN